jgi:nucleotide-binding universal stress UspA family protein
MSFFPTSVVVGTDGTPESRHALEAAVELARATGSPLHLLHVRSTSGSLHGRPGMTPPQRETTEAEGRQLLEREAAAAAELGLEVAGTHLRHGDHLAMAMADAASELDAGVLVIGDSASGRLAQLLTTAASTTTVRRSKGSVLVVR